MPIDVEALKARVDLLELIGRDTRLKRVASTRGGEYAGPCPFCGGRDRLRVQPAQRRWWCRGCLGNDRWQDAGAYVQRRDRITDFSTACAHLAATADTSIARPAPRFARAPRLARVMALRELLPDDIFPSPTWQRRAKDFVDECEQQLQAQGGTQARAYLQRRGLNDATLLSWHVGFQPAYRRYEPGVDWDLASDRVYIPRGIVLPWLTDGQPTHLQVRTSSRDRQRRYLSLSGVHPRLFGGETLRPGRPAMLVEGVLDAMLIHQEATGLVGVASLGSCSKLPSLTVLQQLSACRPLLEGYDADIEGDAGGLRLRQVLPALVRVRPPTGKDPTDFRQRGGSIRGWVSGLLAPACGNDQRPEAEQMYETCVL